MYRVKLIMYIIIDDILSGHSKDLCIYALTEVIKYFKSRSTSVYMYVVFLDASKTFDKISH